MASRPEIQSVTITPAYPNKVNAKASVKIAVSAIDKEIVFQKVLIYAGDGIYAGEQLGGLKISQNLLTGTKDFSGWNNSGSWTLAKGTDGYTVASKAQSGLTSRNWISIYSPKVAAQKGETFTFSCYFMIDDVSEWNVNVPYIFEVYNSSGTRIQYQDVAVNLSNSNKPTITAGKWIYFYSTHTVTADYATTVAMRVALFQNGSIHVKKCMIEYGEHTTDYIPS